jgi:glycosyltransferase involved in cell wall biosynthesis
MRVLVLHSRYLSGPASGENQVVDDETRLLEAAGHRVWRYSPEPAPNGAANLVRTGASAVWSRSARSDVARIVRRNHVDVVHVHNLFPTLSPSVLDSAGDVPVILTLHNYRLMCLPADLFRDGRVCERCVGRIPWRGVAFRCYRGSALGSGVLATSLSVHRALGSFDRVTRFLAVSQFVKQKHVEAGIDPDRILVKRHFAWPAPRRERAGEYFVYLGRLAPEKGVETLLEAWRRGPSLGGLLVVGDGPIEQALRRDAPAGVEFVSRVDAARVPSILRRARALLVPSRWHEPAHRGVLEAYAVGVPVVASRVGGLTEVVRNDETGILVAPDSPAAWHDAVGSLLSDRESERLGSGAWREWAARFGPEHGLRALEATYQNAIGGTGVDDHDGSADRTMSHEETCGEVAT